jgi:DNA modification methylase
LEFSNTESNGKYSSLCRKYNLEVHPARYPIQLPEFFTNFLSDSGDLVLDPFAGSNATGEAAQKWDRKWLSIELKESYLRGSMTRFFDDATLEQEFGFKQPLQ